MQSSQPSEGDPFYAKLADEYGLTGDMRDTFLLNAPFLRPVGPHDVRHVARLVLECVRSGAVTTPNELGLLCTLVAKAPEDRVLRFFATPWKGVDKLRIDAAYAGLDRAAPALLADLKAKLVDSSLDPEQRARLEQASAALRKAHPSESHP